MISNANEPRVATPLFGRGLLDTLPTELFSKPVVFTQPEPWAMVAHRFPKNTMVFYVETMEHEHVKATTKAIGKCSAIFGVGGGSAIDHAKYAAWVLHYPLVLCPTILSVDAPFTKAIGVRESSRVRYVGEVYPDYLLVDFGLISSAPRLLNIVGVGDILSIFTALWDWRVASRWNGEFYDADVANQSQALLDRLLAAASDVRDVTDLGLRLLAELYVNEVRLCELVGSSRPEEGSEHYIAYCLEHMTGRHFIHGSLVSMCVLLAGIYQGQDVSRIADFLQDIGLDCTYRGVGTSPQEMFSCLLAMRSYLHEEKQLLPGVFHFRDGISPEDAAKVLAEFEDIMRI